MYVCLYTYLHVNIPIAYTYPYKHVTATLWKYTCVTLH